MKVICSYCREHFEDKEPLDDLRPTHSICDHCFDYYSKQWDGLSLDDYLSQFNFPVLAVNDEGRVIGLNTPMQKALGKTKEDCQGLLGGEVMECQFARLKDGCGQTIHCEACTIRNAVTETFQTQKPLKSIPVLLDQGPKKLRMTISTTYIDGYVTLAIEKTSR